MLCKRTQVDFYVGVYHSSFKFNEQKQTISEYEFFLPKISFKFNTDEFSSGAAYIFALTIKRTQDMDLISKHWTSKCLNQVRHDGSMTLAVFFQESCPNWRLCLSKWIVSENRRHMAFCMWEIIVKRNRGTEQK